MHFLTDERGLTLAELMVAMAVSSVLLVAVVSASLFMQRYLSGWHKQDLLSEELAFVATELDKALASAERIECFADSLRVTTAGTVTSYVWRAGLLRKGSHRLSHADVWVDSLAVREKALLAGAADTILAGGTTCRGLYDVFIKVSYKRTLSDSLQIIVRNSHDFIRYTP